MLRGGEPMPESTECGFVLPLLFIGPLAPAAAAGPPPWPLDVRRPLLLLPLPPTPPLPLGAPAVPAAVDGTEKVLELDDEGD